MNINDYIQKKSEGLKRMGAIFWILNKIETQIISYITVFFSDLSKNNQWKTIIFNRALFDEHIFSTLESKRLFLKQIINNLNRIAEWKGICFEKDKWLKICTNIKKIQKIRNDLAHNFINFSDNGDKASYMDSKNFMGKLNNKEIDLNKELELANQISEDFMELLPKFVESVQLVLNAPDPEMKN